MKNLSEDKPVKAFFYLLDKTHDLELVREETYCGMDVASVLTMTPNSVHPVTLVQI